MGVTHIMRGEEFISSTPKFLSLYEALGITPPHFATMPVVLGPDGKKKLSKRDGAKDVLAYRDEGYLPEAVVNFLALLGWHPEGDKEVLTVEELIHEFNVAKLQKGGAKFDETKLTWFNHEHIKRLSDDAFVQRLTDYLHAPTSMPAYLPQISGLLKERSRTLADAAQAISGGEFSFLEETIATPSPDLVLQGSKSDAATVRMHLQKARDLLQDQDAAQFSAEQVKECIFPYATEVGRSAVLWPLRVALSGMEKSPDPFMLAELLGKQRTLSRIEQALQVL